MFLNKFKQVKNHLYRKPKAKNTQEQGGLTVRTDIRGGTLLLNDGN